MDVNAVHIAKLTVPPIPVTVNIALVQYGYISKFSFGILGILHNRSFACGRPHPVSRQDSQLFNRISLQKLTFENLPAGERCTLTITAADLSVRMPILEGTVNGTAEVWAPQRDDNQQAIADLLETGEPLTWLFMGDSITHGAKYTFGRDSISQMP